MTAKYTIAHTSDKFGNLKNLCTKHGLDKLTAYPDFAERSGYIFTKEAAKRAANL